MHNDRNVTKTVKDNSDHHVRRSRPLNRARLHHPAGWDGRYSWFHRNQFTRLSPANQDEPQPPMPERWDDYCWSEKLTLVTTA
jgi:hypothetical protein